MTQDEVKTYHNPFLVPALSLVAVGGILGAFSTTFFFDSTVKYCDLRTEPCKYVVVRKGEEVNDRTLIHLPQESTGLGWFKLFLALSGFSSSIGGWIYVVKALEEQEGIDHEIGCDLAVIQGQREIEADKQLQIAAKKAQADVDGDSLIYLDVKAQFVQDELGTEEEDEIFFEFARRKQAEEEAQRKKELEETKLIVGNLDLKDLSTETADAVKFYQTPDNLLQMLIGAGDVSLVGAKGSGKTTLTAWLLRERIKKGHLLILFNHHAVMTFYSPLYCFGRDVPEELIGKQSVMANLEECQLHIAIGLSKCQQLMDYRYTLYKSGKLKGEPAITILFEEIGEYDGIETELREIKAAIKQNLKLELEPYDGLTDLQVAAANVPVNIWQQTTKRNLISSRKGEIFVITTTQDDTNEMSGKLKGLQELRKKGVVRLKLIPKPGTDGKQGAVPSGKGELSMPGVTDNKGKPISVKVDIPDLREKLPGNSDEDYFDFSAIATPESGFDLWNFDGIAACQSKGLTMIPADLDDELSDIEIEEDEDNTLHIEIKSTTKTNNQFQGMPDVSSESPEAQERLKKFWNLKVNEKKSKQEIIDLVFEDTINKRLLEHGTREDIPQDFWDLIENMYGFLCKRLGLSVDDDILQGQDIIQKVLEYFKSARNKTPKTMHDLKKASRLEGYTDEQLTKALEELIRKEELNFDRNQGYSLPDWDV